METQTSNESASAPDSSGQKEPKGLVGRRWSGSRSRHWWCLVGGVLVVGRAGDLGAGRLVQSACRRTSEFSNRAGGRNCPRPHRMCAAS